MPRQINNKTMNEISQQLQGQDVCSIWIWVCIAVVIVVAIGRAGYEKIKTFNHKHHIIQYDQYSTTIEDDDDEDEITIYE